MFMEMLTIYRTVWLAGRPRGGKTSLSIAMALNLVANSYADKICINTPLTIGTLVDIVPIKAAQQLENVVTVVDEAWIEFGATSKAADRDAWLAYRGKLNQYLILPSARDLHRSFNDFIIERTMNWLPFGIPLWVYTFNLTSSKVKNKKGRRAAPDVGKYNWWYPQRVFKYYNHLVQPKHEYYIYTF